MANKLHLRIPAFLLFAASLFGSVSQAQTITCEARSAPSATLVEMLEKDPATTMGALAEAADAARETLPATALDPLAVIFEGATEPDELLNWIRENVALIPYQGTLRGARGVLADRQGNSLDIALLLADLLANSGYDARLARASLNADEVAELVAQLGIPILPPPQTEKSDPRLNILKHFDATAASDCGLGAADWINAQSKALLAILDIKDAGWSEADSKSIATDLSDHWWVQANVAGTWVDLDPTSIKVAAERTYSLPDMPNGLQHSVKISLQIETSIGGKIATVEVASIENRASIWSGNPVSIEFAPIDKPKIGADRGPNDLVRAYSEVSEWVPVFRWNDQVMFGDVFSIDGRTRPYDGDESTSPGGLATTGGGLLGGLQTGGDGENSPDKRPGYITALWIEFAVHRPGRPEILERRYLFDSRGLSARSEGSPVEAEPDGDQVFERIQALRSVTSILIAAGDLGPAIMPDRALRDLAQAYRLMSSILGAVDDKGGKSLAETISASPISPLPLYYFAAYRGGYSPFGVVPLDGAGIAMLRSVPSFENGRRALHIDIVKNDVSPMIGREAVLRQGVADTVLEHALLARPGHPSVNTASVFAGALIRDDPWTLYQSNASLNDLALAPDLFARLQAEIERGHWVVAPSPTSLAANTPFAYWSYDPRNGRIVGMTKFGTGGEFVEYALNLFNKLAAIAHCVLDLEEIEAGTRSAAEKAEKVFCVISSVAGLATGGAKIGLWTKGKIKTVVKGKIIRNGIKEKVSDLVVEEARSLPVWATVFDHLTSFGSAYFNAMKLKERR